MKIRTKLWIITILPFVFFMGVGFIVAHTSHLIDEENEKTHIADDLRRSLDDLTVLTHEYFVSPVERALVQWQKRHDSLQGLLLQASERFEDTEDKSSLKQMTESHETIKGLFPQLVMTDEKKGERALELRGRLFNRILQELSLMGAEPRRLHEKCHDKTLSITKIQNRIMISFFAALSAVIFVIVRLLEKGIVKPIEALHRGTEIVGSGDLNYKAGTDTGDEIGRLSRAFDGMTENLKITTASRDELEREVAARTEAEVKLRALMQDLERINKELGQRLNEIKTLRGMLPICSYCKKIRDDQGYWQQMEMYVRDHSEAEFSHGMCPDCAEKAQKEFEEFKKKMT